MGRRSRKRRAERHSPATREPSRNGAAAERAADNGPAPGTERGYARSRARTDAVRARLKPLAPGERPRVVTVAAILAGLIAVANLVLFLAGWEVRGREPSTSGTLIFCGVMTAAAIGMWMCQYWAVLGFEMLLGIGLVGAAISLLRVSNVEGVLVCLGIFVLFGPLFWFLIRAMARLQMPRR